MITPNCDIANCLPAIALPLKHRCRLASRILKNHQKAFLEFNKSAKYGKKEIDTMFFNSQRLLIFLWFCCMDSFCSLTAQQNERLSRIVTSVPNLTIQWNKKQCVFFSRLEGWKADLKSTYYRQKLVVHCSHQAGGWAVGRAYTSGKVSFLPSLGRKKEMCTAPLAVLHAPEAPGLQVLFYICSLIL